MSTHIHCIEKMNTCCGAQRLVLGVGALFKGTLVMPRIWTSILQLLLHIVLFFYFWSEWYLTWRPSSPQARSLQTELLPPNILIKSIWGLWAFDFMEPFYVLVLGYFFIVPIFYSCLGECCNTVLLWGSRNVLWTVNLHLIFHQHEGGQIITEFLCKLGSPPLQQDQISYPFSLVKTWWSFQVSYAKIRSCSLELLTYNRDAVLGTEICWG